ncbi:hypothetical protein QQ045_010298 [Rhodiola kirilowii]
MVSSSSHEYDDVSSYSPLRRVIKLNGKRSGEESMKGLKKLKKSMARQEHVVAVAEDDEKAVVVSEDAFKSGPFQRSIFSEDDEILLLQRIIEHKKAGNDPSTFYDFVKSDLQNQVTVQQVYRKKKGLKAKFFKNVKRGKDVSFDNAHDKLIFDLSKKIWPFQEQYAEPKNVHKHRPASSSTAAPLLCVTELLRTKDVRFNEELIRQCMELLGKKVLAAIQVPTEPGNRWFQGTAVAVRQFTWVFEVYELEEGSVVILHSTIPAVYIYIRAGEASIGWRRIFSPRCLCYKGNVNGPKWKIHG